MDLQEDLSINNCPAGLSHFYFWTCTCGRMGQCGRFLGKKPLMSKKADFGYFLDFFWAGGFFFGGGGGKIKKNYYVNFPVLY